MSELRVFFAYVSGQSFAGVPLDIIAHLLVGTLIFFLARFGRLSVVASLWMVFIAAAAKELFFDFRVWAVYGFYLEPVKDIIVSLLVPAVLSISVENSDLSQKRRHRRRRA